VAGLSRQNKVSSVFLALQGLAILFLSSPAYRPLYASFLTADTLQTQLTHHAVTALAVHQLAVVRIAYLAAAWLLAGAIIHMLSGTVWRKQYEAGLKKRAGWFHWVTSGIGAALIIATVGLLAGVYDGAALLTLILLTVAAALAGFGYEYAGTMGKRARTAQCLSGWLAVIFGLMPWVVVALYMLNAEIFGNGPVLPAYWFWLCGVALAGMVLWAGNIYMGQVRRGRWASYLYAERVGMGISVIVKTAAAWLLFATFLRP